MKRVLLTMVFLILASVFILCSCDYLETEKTEVVFDTGTAEKESIVLEDFSELEIPDDPKREGYVFDGWYFDENYTEPFSLTALFSKEKGGVIKLYAKWECAHSSFVWKTEREATCKAEGLMYKECEGCKKRLESEKIEKLAEHTPAEAEIKSYVDSTCKAEGSYREVVYCSVCDEFLSSVTKTIDKKDCTPTDWITDTAASCDADGLKHKECKVCHKTLASENIPKLEEHTTSEWITASPATCKDDGLKYKECTVCHTTLVSEKIPMLSEHTASDWIVDSPATCGAAGKRHKACTVCDEVLEEEVLQKLENHTLSEPVTENYIDSDCENAGSYNLVVYCSVCRLKLSSEAQAIDKKEHTPSDWIIDKAATCKEAGAKHKECTWCEKTLEEATIDKLTEHTLGGEVRENLVDSNCKNEGTYDAVVYCTVCKKELIRVTKTVEKKDHTPSSWIVETEPTATTSGLKYKYCLVCNDRIAEEVMMAYGLATAKFTYRVNTDGKTCAITGISELYSFKLVIPSEIDGYTVTEIVSIDEEAMVSGQYSDIVSVTIPDTVTAIGSGAFMSHNGIVSVTLGAGVKSIANNAFYNCHNLWEIANYSTISLTAGSEDNGRIAYNAKHIYDPRTAESKVSEIGNFVFYDTGSKAYLMSYIGDTATRNLPSDFNGRTYEIAQYAFYESERIKGPILMPDSITAIGEAAFWQCPEITAVYFGTGIKDIGLRAFCRCEKIKTVEMPEITTEINIGIDVFDGCDALTYTEYGNCKYIGNASNPYFALVEGDSYRAPNIHKDCMIIAGGAFDGFSNITEITINVPYISYHAFYNCKSLKTVTIGEKVKTIGKYAFAYCQALTTLTFEGDGTKNIRDYAFANCKKLSSIEFGDSKFNISKGAFLACTALESVNRLYAVTIEKEAFKDCTGLHSVSIYSGTVKAAAFSGCKYLYSITIGKNVTYFDAAAFAGCENIINVWFQNTSGWQCADNAEFENAVNIASSELNDRTNAATVLKKYINCIWKRTA